MKNILLILFILISVRIQAQSAVLSTGSWHRITVSENGIYRIRYDDLLSRGILQAPVPSSQIALFGGPNGAIPIENIPSETFDLQEIAIFVRNNNGNGMFGPGDYILFYGQSPHTWTWNTTHHRQGHHNHTNVFTDVMVYFLTTDFSGNGKRIENKPAVDGTPNVTITNFRDFFRHERDEANPFRSSQEWFGERMDQIARNLNIELHLPGLITDSLVNIRTRVVVNEPAMAVMSSNSNHSRRDTLSVTTARPSGHFMMEAIRDFSWNLTSERPRISFEYIRLSNNPSWMHLDYIIFHYRRSLSLGHTNRPLQFRFTDQASGIGSFIVSSADQSTQVWDISSPLSPKKINQTTSGNTFAFSAFLSDTLEFIGFSNNHIHTITQFEVVPNQNFHAETGVEYVMVVHPNFREEAERLAEFHRNRGLNVLLISPQEVFNEFSYGRQDPMAIRRMMRHFRNKALAKNSDVLPRYLLLFGSPSYDYRNRTSGGNFVLNYQFPTGLVEGQSFASDGFFGFLGNGETGFRNTDSLRIGIGRFPARTIEQARTLVNKTIDYATPQLRNFGDWRNVVANLADDGVTEPFVQTFEAMPHPYASGSNRANYFETDFNTRFREINVEKIYIDAFPQVATPSGARFPAAKEALRQRIERGMLILNYQGHSGPVTLADEDIMNVADIQNFSNIDRLFVFFTASCNFAQYDDPNLISGGEWSVLSPRGGAVAHIGATRVAYTHPNDEFHGVWNRFVLQRREDGSARSLGETMKLSKNRMQNTPNIRQFVLLGDPAISLALPKHRIITDSINGNSIKDGADTIRALDRTSISGRIVDFDSTFLENFNGEITITVFDKPTRTQTLGHNNSTAHGRNPVIPFYVQNNILYRGRVPVINGEFRVEFWTPKNINFTYGFGKISYYAFCRESLFDAAGVFNDVIIGGFGENFDLVAEPPILELFLNDENFRSGNISCPNPILFANITDQYGISHSGAGIGHNITLIINDDFRNQIWLNDFFEYLPDSGDGKVHGRLEFPMFDLSPGRYHLRLRVSNVFNVSADTTLEFVVVGSENQIIGTLYNYPNPIRDFTQFYFTHNAPRRVTHWEIDFFDMSGRWVTRINPRIPPQESPSANGFAIITEKLDLGNSLGQGMYLYRLRVVFEDGSTAYRTEKLVVGK
ncbi:MAG: type IX secretion system sortase PorU [Bacteroidales bacterium]|nr:type IX secretion system sortase PorU [Bacteroidales bacterium]